MHEWDTRNEETNEQSHCLKNAKRTEGEQIISYENVLQNRRANILLALPTVEGI